MKTIRKRIELFKRRYRDSDDWDCQLYKKMPQGYIVANDEVEQFLIESMEQVRTETLENFRKLAKMINSSTPVQQAELQRLLKELKPNE